MGVVEVALSMSPLANAGGPNPIQLERLALHDGATTTHLRFRALR